MTQHLTEYANKDTPQNVKVPETWPGLLTWAIGRFGIGVVFAAMLWGVYMDFRALNDRVLSSFEAQARVNAEQVAAMRALSQRIEESIYRSRQQP